MRKFYGNSKLIKVLKSLVSVSVFIVFSFLCFSCVERKIDDESNFNGEMQIEPKQANFEKPDYLFYATVGQHDLYIDTYKNIFIFKNGADREILLKGEYPEESLDEIESIYRHVKDKYGNLYIEYYHNNFCLEKIDKDLNIEELSKYVCGFEIIDGVLFYADYEGKRNVIKYDNNLKEIVYTGREPNLLDKIDNNTFMLSGRNSSNNEKYFEYKNGIIRQLNLAIKYSDLVKHTNKKIQVIEKIEKYHPSTDDNIKQDELNDNDQNNINSKNYLYINDDGKVNYYYNGTKVSNMLVFLEGNLNTNKGPICFSDTYAYYFGFNGDAMPSGKITPADRNSFETDGTYRILKKCKYVYSNLTNGNRYELYNNYFLMGEYEQDDIKENGKENIKWIVLSDDGDNVLLLSKYVIDFCKISSNYLNEVFYNTAFTDDEKEKIVDKDGKGKIFLIDKTTLNKYQNEYKNKYKNSELVSAIATNYTINKGIEISRKNDNYYHHAGYVIDNYEFVNSEGNISNIDEINLKYGIRPAMWVKKE